MKEETLSRWNIIIKTLISVTFVGVLWWYTSEAIWDTVATTPQDQLEQLTFYEVINCFYAFLLYAILPYNTLLWIKNWKKEDFIKTHSALSLISTIIKVPIAMIAIFFLIPNIINIIILPILWIFGSQSPIAVNILSFVNFVTNDFIMTFLFLVVFCYMLPRDITYWIKQWNK